MKNLIVRFVVYLFAINGIALALYVVNAAILAVTGDTWMLTAPGFSETLYVAFLVVAAYPATFVGKKPANSHKAK